MDLVIILRLISGIFLLLANAFFVSVEFALTRLRQHSKEEIAGDEGLEKAWEMTEELEIYLTGCQVGITATSILLGVITEPAVTKLIELLFEFESIGSIQSHSISIVVSVILINFVHTVWGEQAPTYVGVERSKTVAKYFAPPLYWWTIAIYPVLYLGDWLTKATLRIFGITIERSWTKDDTEQEKPRTNRAMLKGQITDLLKDGDLSRDRREEVVKALEIDEVPVREIMVPRDKIIFLSVKKSLSENLSLIQSGKSRYPLVGESENEFLGVIYTSEMLANIEDLISGNKKIKDFCRPGMSVAPDLSVSKLIDQFQRKHQELALVKRTNELKGLVTITDALEVIVGNAEDPLDIESDDSK